jgi:hypothetical protein
MKHCKMAILCYFLFMSVAEIIREIEALPSAERFQVLECLNKISANDVPESFRQGMEEAMRGEGDDLDEALKDLEEV